MTEDFGKAASEREKLVAGDGDKNTSTSLEPSGVKRKASGYKKPATVTVIEFVGVLVMLGGILLIMRGGFYLGISAVVSTVFWFGFAKIIELLARIEWNQRSGSE